MKLLPRKELAQIHHFLKTLKFNLGQFVCTEGQDSKCIYIVVKGEFEVSKVIDVNENDLPGGRGDSKGNRKSNMRLVLGSTKNGQSRAETKKLDYKNNKFRQ